MLAARMVGPTGCMCALDRAWPRLAASIRLQVLDPPLYTLVVVPKGDVRIMVVVLPLVHGTALAVVNPLGPVSYCCPAIPMTI